EGLALLEGAWRAADGANDAVAAYWASVARGLVAARLLGDPRDARGWYEQELAKPRAARAPFPRAALLANLGDAHLLSGGRARAGALRIGAGPRAMGYGPRLLWGEGDWDRAVSEWARAREQFRRTGDRWNEWWTTDWLARAYRVRGEPAQAELRLRDALAI